jgi:hypothetical protein
MMDKWTKENYSKILELREKINMFEITGPKRIRRRNIITGNQRKIDSIAREKEGAIWKTLIAANTDLQAMYDEIDRFDKKQTVADRTDEAMTPVNLTDDPKYLDYFLCLKSDEQVFYVTDFKGCPKKEDDCWKNCDLTSEECKKLNEVDVMPPGVAGIQSPKKTPKISTGVYVHGTTAFHNFVVEKAKKWWKDHPEARIAQSERLKKTRETPEFQKNFMAAHGDPASRKRKSKVALKLWQDPNYKGGRKKGVKDKKPRRKAGYFGNTNRRDSKKNALKVLPSN